MVSPVHDFTARRHRLVAVKRRVTHEHFKHDGTDAPPIALQAVSFLQENFWSDVVRRTHRTERQTTSILLPVRELFRALLIRLDCVRQIAVAVSTRRRFVLQDVRENRLLIRRIDGFAQSKVAQLHVTILVEQQVVRFDVSVNKVVSMNRLKRRHRLRQVKPRLFLRERIASNQQSHHVSTR